MKRLVAVLMFFVAVLGIAAGYQFYLDHKGSTVEEARSTLPARLESKSLAMGKPIFVRIFKEESLLEVWMQRNGRWTLFQGYPICRWSGQLGPKLKTGDKQAPEGFYTVGLTQLNPNSRWHLSFNLGFPNRYDRSYGRTGSFLMVHGGCSSAGCYAMTNAAVDDIYRLVEAALRGGQSGVPVHIFPFRMTAANMAQHRHSRWIAFWRDLKRGYEFFETRRAVPAIRVVERSYIVEG